VDKTEVTFALDEVQLDRDIIIEFSPKNKFEPVCLASNLKKRGEKVGMLRLYPDFSDIYETEEPSSEFIFIIDCSYSMSGSSIESAKKALELCFRSLNDGDKFNIIKFGSEVEAFSRRLLTFNRHNFNKAISYISEIDADMGGTELEGAIELAVKNYKRTMPRNVVLITDGGVSNAREIVKSVSKRGKGIRFFTFGVGYGASQTIIKGLAKATNGAFEMIQPNENIEKKVLRHFSRIYSPRYNNLKIEGINCSVEEIEEIPSIYDGDSFTLFFKFKELSENAKIMLVAEVAGSNWVTISPVNFYKNKEVISVLWVNDHINQLRAQRDDYDWNENHSDINEEILRLAIKYNLLTNETAFVAIEKRKDEDKTYDPEYRRIPVNLVKDYPKMTVSYNAVAAPHAFNFFSTPIATLCSTVSPVGNSFECKELFESKMELDLDDYDDSEDFEETNEWFIEIGLEQSFDGDYSAKAIDIINENCNKEIETAYLISFLTNLLDDKQSELEQGIIERLANTLFVLAQLDASSEAKNYCSKSIRKAKKWAEQFLNKKTISKAIEKFKTI
jgi:Ca-activated chloride channel family protein